MNSIDTLNMIGPVGSGSIAGLIALVAMKWLEYRAKLPAITAEIEFLRRAHSECEARVLRAAHDCDERLARLEARVVDLLERFTDRTGGA